MCGTVVMVAGTMTVVVVVVVVAHLSCQVLPSV